MDEIKDNIEDFREAGKITAKIREESKRLIMVDEPLLDIADTIEKMIYDEGAKPAFPVNISINEIAAHYTPAITDERTIGDKDVVKIDLGAQIRGAIGDTAYTIDLSGEHEKLVNASEEALDNAINAMKPGVKVGDIGAVIEETANKYGFKPIRNLSGHKIKTGLLHSGIDIPNVKTEDEYTLKEGDIFAIEPFMTTGAGYVVDTDTVEIFSFYGTGATKMRQTKRILEHIIREYVLLPFAERWIIRKFSSRLIVNAVLKEMLESQLVIGYPMLKEAEDGLVSQAEHTVLVTADGCEILTK